MGSLHAWAGTRVLQRPQACCCPPAQQAARRRVPEPCHAMPNNPTLMAKAEDWLQLDHDPASRAQIIGLLDNGDVAQLEELLGRRLEFGTAGLRERMGPGFNRMNAITVQQTTQGLCRYLQKQCPEQLQRKGVIIGYDARHNSETFAHVAAGVFVHEGIRVKLFGRPVPTPLVAAGALYMNCAAAIVITASHNTKEYNGYKLYWSNACQIIPPHDHNIAGSILDNLALWQLPSKGDARLLQLVSDPMSHVCWTYFTRLKEQLCFCEAQNGSNARVVYTPLHGVGLKAVQQAFQAFGLPAPHVVAQQAQPDPEFPTVSFPNPEEGKGTWRLGFEEAIAQGAQLVLANDPDADRLAAAERCEHAPGGFRAFSGNEIGLLLAHWTWTNRMRQKPQSEPGHCAMLSSAVSSKALAAMAALEGFHFQETLTGFKWLSNVAGQLEHDGYEVLFAFEEAIGFMFPALVKDKDGIAAACAFAEMAGDLARNGCTVQQHLQALYTRYGHFVSRASYFVSPSAAHSRRMFDALRGTDSSAAGSSSLASSSSTSSYPACIGGVPVTHVRDLGTGLDTSQPDSQAVLPWVRGDMMITFTLGATESTGTGGGCTATLTLRASATEPKLKWYLEVSGADISAAEAMASVLEAAVETELVQPDLFGLMRRPS